MATQGSRWSWLETLGRFGGMTYVNGWNEIGVKPPNAIVLQNMAWDMVNGINEMRGMSAITKAASPTASPWTYFEGHTNSAGTEGTLCAAEGKLWFTEDGVTFTEKQSGLTSSWQHLFRHTQLGFSRILTNTQDNILEYELATCYEVGNPAPDQSATTATEGAAGLLGAGKYYYKVTFVNDSDTSNESNPDSLGGVDGANEVVVTIAALKKIELADVPLGDAANNCTSRRIYRTEAGGTTWYYAGAIADNTTTTYSDNLADADLTTTSTPPTDNYTALTSAQDVQIFYGHLFCVGTGTNRNKLYWAKQNYPDLLPAFNFKVFDSPIRAIKILGDHLYIFQKNQVTKVTYEGIYSGISNDTVDAGGAYAFSYHVVTDEMGIYAYGKAVCDAPNGLMVVDENGYLVHFDGWEMRKVITQAWKPFAEQTNLRYISMEYDEGKGNVLMVFASATSSARKVFEYNVEGNVLQGKLNEIVGLNANVCGRGHNKDDDNIEPMWFGVYTGAVLIYSDYNNLNFGSEDISSIWESPWLDFGAPEEEKQFNKEGVVFVVSSGYRTNNTATNTISVTIYLSPDNSNVDYSETFTVTDTITLPETAGVPAQKVHRVTIPSRKFKAMKIKLTHSVTDYSWGLHNIIIPELKAKGSGND